MLVAIASKVAAEAQGDEENEQRQTGKLYSSPKQADQSFGIKNEGIDYLKGNNNPSSLLNNFHHPLDANKLAEVYTQQTQLLDSKTKSKQNKNSFFKLEDIDVDGNNVLAVRDNGLVIKNGSVPINMSFSFFNSTQITRDNESYVIESQKSLDDGEAFNQTANKMIQHAFSESVNYSSNVSFVASSNKVMQRWSTSGYADVGMSSSSLRSSASIASVSTNQDGSNSMQCLSIGETPPRKQDYFFYSILATIFCFVTFGPCAIFNANKARQFDQSGDKKNSVKYHTRARYFCVATVLIGLCLWTCFIVVLINVVT